MIRYDGDMENAPLADQQVFSIATDFPGGLVYYKLTRLWDKETYRQYHDAMVIEMSRFRNIGRSFCLIGDLTEFPPQPQNLNDMRAELVVVARSMGMRKCAVIYSNPITKMQLGRLSEQSYQFFVSKKDALAWVAE
ncbi:hypothetical protein GCM10009087_40840 [Sphingomonas oligophenolica]|uniref:STAS/SEC14 domain-containing protein n=1 Tax=Sphingomonas oligophenolica TaxID=301154 RepID=A0ABU9Y224_9SPHN